MEYSEVLKQRANGKCLVIINEQIYDLTRIKPFHPVGELPIDIFSGKDATWLFNLIPFHKKEAQETLAKLKIGSLSNSKSSDKIPTLKLPFIIATLAIIFFFMYVFTL